MMRAITKSGKWQNEIRTSSKYYKFILLWLGIAFKWNTKCGSDQLCQVDLHGEIVMIHIKAKLSTSVKER